MKLLWQSICLIGSFIFVFIWQNTILSIYTIQIFGSLITIFILVSFKKKGLNPFNNIDNDEPFSIAILCIIMLLLVFSTGGISSPLFFLLYFLIFSIAFVFEPPAVFIFAIGIFLIFLPDTLKNDVYGNAMRTGSILLVSPLGFFFGKEYSNQEEKNNIIDNIATKSTNASNIIINDATEIINNEPSLKKDSIEKINEILDEAESLNQSNK
ncbi:MAG: hypothetical protein NTZ20_04625 [Candidatus Levybacteria bacterium]|nr:hypothetical protein [Candidatus Levybacteria bacterium]MSU26080.1 hypothetical protein [Candidatus Levybacteria bacterium]